LKRIAESEAVLRREQEAHDADGETRRRPPRSVEAQLITVPIHYSAQGSGRQRCAGLTASPRPTAGQKDAIKPGKAAEFVTYNDIVIKNLDRLRYEQVFVFPTGICRHP
jgi:hypothetical protein